MKKFEKKADKLELNDDILNNVVGGMEPGGENNVIVVEGGSGTTINDPIDGGREIYNGGN
ncbi:MAG: hypothetical protein HUJ65_03445 [Oscillospiraceae bacterium]|nr:hypothetical protein [Oscillospiraceae bacterium]